MRYDELDSHQRRCRSIWVSDEDRNRRFDWIEDRLSHVETMLVAGLRETEDELEAPHRRRRLRE